MSFERTYRHSDSSRVAARRQRHLVELRAVPRVEKDAPVRRILDNRVQASADLVDRLVQQQLRRAAVVDRADRPIAARDGVVDLRDIVDVEQLVGGPLPPLVAVDLAQVVGCDPVRVREPLGVLVRVLVPHLAAERPEVGGAAIAAQESNQLADRRFERQPARRDRGKAVAGEVEPHRGARHAHRAYAGAIRGPRAGGKDRLDQFQVLLHRGLRTARPRRRLVVVSRA